MLGKKPVMLTEDPNLLVTFSEQDVFLSKPAEGKDPQMDGGNSHCLASQFRMYQINRHLETFLGSIFPTHK